jgi:hypothetical protein
MKLERRYEKLIPTLEYEVKVSAKYFERLSKMFGLILMLFLLVMLGVSQRKISYF